MLRCPMVMSIVLFGLTGLRAESAPGLKVPPGFEVTEFAGNELAPDITCLAVDPNGRVTVAGPGYIRVLVDEQHSGKATRAIDLSKNVRGAAHGLLWKNSRELLAVVDGGLWRYDLDGSRELVQKLKTGGEHDCHSLARGPHDWIYLLCGNSAGIDKSFANTNSSPITDPVAGCVVRFTWNFRESEIVADGFRNPYGFAFNANGDLFTFDSDNERCVSMPWYEGTRFYHVRPGGHYGWRNPQRSDSWRLPPYAADVVAPLADLGRGSPTGVAYYGGGRWPRRYVGGFFLLDWTFGRIYFVPVQRAGDSYVAEKPEVFLEAVGANGFAPTAAAFFGDELFVAIGGRGTRGTVYRIRCTKPEEQAFRLRVNALPSPSWVNNSQQHLSWGARQHDTESIVDLYRHREQVAGQVRADAVESNWNEPGRFLRHATARLYSSLSAEQQEKLRKRAETTRQLLTVGFGLVDSAPSTAIDFARQAYESGTTDERLDAIRLMQIGLGDLTAASAKSHVWEGYSARRAVPTDRDAPYRRLLREAFPSGDANLDRELSRTLAMVEDDSPGVLADVLAKIRADSDPVEDIHYLIVMSRLNAKRTEFQTRAIAGALLALDSKLAKRKAHQDTNWPLRIAELHAELARKDLALNTALLRHADFGRPGHALFARCAGFDRKTAAAIFVACSQGDPAFAWSADLVGLLGELPAETSRPILLRLWDRGGLEDAILPQLAKQRRREDAARLLGGLTSTRLATVAACLDGLEDFPPTTSAESALGLIRGLRLLPTGREGDALRKRIAALLARQSKQDFGTDKLRWTDWLGKAYPDVAKKLGGADGVDVAAWQQRFDGIDWSGGNETRGRLVYAKAGCSTCHSGGQALGPDLSGAAERFSRSDLLTAIVQPSKDISPRYRTTQIETTDGKTYLGLIIYEAVDGVLLQTGPAETIRIAGDKIESRRITETSLMPVSLLDKLTDGEIADLFAHLRFGLRRPSQ